MGKLIIRLLDDYELALDYLITMLVNNYLNKQLCSKEDMLSALNLGTEWSEQVGVPRVYQHVFNFVKAYQSMNSLLAHRNAKGLWDFVSNCDFILLEGQGGQLNESMVYLLNRVKGVDLYFDFLMRIIRGA